jgi:hypothetical protein
VWLPMSRRGGSGVGLGGDACVAQARRTDILTDDDQGFSKVDDPSKCFIRVRDEASDLASDVGHLMHIHQ